MRRGGERRLGWGVMGGALINQLVIPAIKAASNATLVAVASRDPDKASALAAQYGAAQAHGSYEALLSDPRVEAVYIPLPNTMHVEWAIRAAAAGKHVLVEKPLALDPADIAPLEEAAAATGVVIEEAFMYRFHPQHARVKALIAAGTIGEVQVVRTAFAYPVPSGVSNIRLDERLGGGATWDVGCYCVSVARFFFEREPLAVYAEATTRPGCAVETSVAAILDFGEGRRAVLDHSVDYGPRSFYELQGTKGTIAVDNAWQMPGERALLYLRSGQSQRTEEVSPADHYQLEVEAFSAAVLERRPAPHGLSDARANAHACAGLLRSIREGRRVPLQPTTP